MKQKEFQAFLKDKIQNLEKDIMSWFTVTHKADGGAVDSMVKMKMALKDVDAKNIGVNEATDMDKRKFFPPSRSGGLPIGGVDMSRQAGTQLSPQIAPQNAQQQQQSPTPQPQQENATQADLEAPNGNNQQQSILNMTPQGQMLNAMAKGGKVKVPVILQKDFGTMQYELNMRKKR